MTTAIKQKTITMQEYLKYEMSTNPAVEIKDISFPNPIILGGCGSSGTTLLKTMLDSHKNIACGQEIALFDRPKLYHTELNELFQMFTTQKFDEINKEQIFPLFTKFGSNFGLFIPNTGKEYHNFSTMTAIFEKSKNLKHFIDLFFSNWAFTQGKKRWAEKTPNNIYCIEEILNLIPDSKFVHVIRDGRDVALSLTQGRDFVLPSAIFRWLSAVEAGIRFRGDPRYYELKYEDLILDTENCLKNLMEFLDEEYDPEMLNYMDKGKNNPLNYGTTPIFTNKIGKWKKEGIDPAILRTFDLTLTNTLNKLNYEV
ncbi:MAG: sulfotransferase [candidate division Zixibacteria bacterium]|nr:sulfotransferase [candidate division Zixibacteria bacterium]